MNESDDTLHSLRHRARQEILDFFQGDREAMRHWMSTEVRGLGYITPEHALQTRAGIDRLRTLIARLENGIPT